METYVSLSIQFNGSLGLLDFRQIAFVPTIFINHRKRIERAEHLGFFWLFYELMHGNVHKYAANYKRIESKGFLCSINIKVNVFGWK